MVRAHRGGRRDTALSLRNFAHAWCYSYLRFKVNVGGGHLGYLEDADGQRDSTQDKQTVVDQDTSQDCMSDTPIAGDMKVIKLK